MYRNCLFIHGITVIPLGLLPPVTPDFTVLVPIVIRAECQDKPVGAIYQGKAVQAKFQGRYIEAGCPNKPIGAGFQGQPLELGFPGKLIGVVCQHIPIGEGFYK